LVLDAAGRRRRGAKAAKDAAVGVVPKRRRDGVAY